jgi:hypothetical protein
MYVPRAMYSLRTSFWIVPRSFAAATPCSSATATYSARSVAAVALIVIDVDTSSSGMPSNRTAHVLERVDRDADPADLAARHRVIAVAPICVGRSNATDRPLPPWASRYL